MEIVLVEWVDARFLEGWQCRCSFDLDIIRCVTTGVLCGETDRSVTVCLHRNEESVSGCMAIPKSAITRMRKLGVKND